jgi:hypothetical protein
MHKFKAYIHVPKAAGSSLRNYILNNRIDYIGHDERIHPEKPDGTYDYVFTIVRNPYDRVVSAYYYLRRGGGSHDDVKDGREYCHRKFPEFIKQDLKRASKKQIHFKPMHYWVYDRCQVKATHIAKMENIKRDLIKIAEELKLPIPDPIPHANRTVHPESEELYTKELREIVYNIYKKDFKLFGYEANISKTKRKRP